MSGSHCQHGEAREAYCVDCLEAAEARREEESYGPEEIGTGCCVPCWLEGKVELVAIGYVDLCHNCLKD